MYGHNDSQKKKKINDQSHNGNESKIITSVTNQSNPNVKNLGHQEHSEIVETFPANQPVRKKKSTKSDIHDVRDDLEFIRDLPKKPN